MHRLDYELKTLCRRFGGGSFGTRNKRVTTLLTCASDLRSAGFADMKARSLKTEHVHRLVRMWLARGLSTNTIKNYVSQLRWWACTIQRPFLIPPTNQELGIPRRALTPIHSKAKVLKPEWLQNIPCERMRTSLQLQQEFGLRREESLKFRPDYAIQGDHIRLQGSWTKGGKPRTIPALKTRQSELLDTCRALARSGSMTPPDLCYVRHLNRFCRVCLSAGIRNMHGLRHGYAQRRYHELAGFESPLAGGPKRCGLSRHERLLDWLARKTVSRELGHERIEVTTTYLGI